MAERLRGRKAVEVRLGRLKRTHGLCEDCQSKGRTEVAKAVDHIVPLALGGSEDDSNTRNLCHSCHQARTAEQFGHRIRIGASNDGWPA